MSDHFCWPSGFVRFVLVRRSQAGHLHSRLAHKSCPTAERMDTASVFAPAKALFHTVPSILAQQRNYVSSPLTDWTKERGENHAQNPLVETVVI